MKKLFLLALCLISINGFGQTVTLKTIPSMPKEQMMQLYKEALIYMVSYPDSIQSDLMPKLITIKTFLESDGKMPVQPIVIRKNIYDFVINRIFQEGVEKYDANKDYQYTNAQEMILRFEAKKKLQCIILLQMQKPCPYIIK
jgi:hypothetical protein